MEEKNRLFEEFDTKKLEEFTADNLDSFRDQVFIEDVNRDLVNDLIRFGAIANQISLSGPISRTLDSKSATIPDKGTANRQTIHTPGAGEVWRCIGLSATWSLDANPTFVVQVGDADPYATMVECTFNATARTTYGEPIVNEVTNSGTREGGFNPDIHYTKDYPLKVLFDYGGTTITTAPVVTAIVVRVR